MTAVTTASPSGAFRGEATLVRTALAVAALHVVDENLRPEAEMVACDHLASGLVPVGVLALVL